MHLAVVCGCSTITFVLLTRSHCSYSWAANNKTTIYIYNTLVASFGAQKGTENRTKYDKKVVGIPPPRPPPPYVESAAAVFDRGIYTPMNASVAVQLDKSKQN